MHWIYAHFIGDYILQNDWMAKNKKTKIFPALVHAITYCVPFLFCSLSWWQIVLIGIQHYIQDRTNFVIWFMKIKGSEKFAIELGPWSVILTDNIIHLFFIAVVVKFLTI
ncbi:hypothetical protein DRQ07_07300 [candidate division KSB1 bacterium]|nr:MAG: hypothetical protein DRQ07_07300 [candidate division KSB1 bacterium]